MSRASATTILMTTLILALFAAAGCGSRAETGVAGDDGTLLHPSKSGEGITAKITLCRKFGKKSGKPIGAGTVFTTGEKAKVRALVELENAFALGKRELMFHLVWVGPDDKKFYKKMYLLSPEEETARIKSSISIPPDRREPGVYTLRVYLFRELLAEKRFELRAEEGG